MTETSDLDKDLKRIIRAVNLICWLPLLLNLVVLPLFAIPYQRKDVWVFDFALLFGFLILIFCAVAVEGWIWGNQVNSTRSGDALDRQPYSLTDVEGVVTRVRKCALLMASVLVAIGIIGCWAVSLLAGKFIAGQVLAILPTVGYPRRTQERLAILGKDLAERVARN